MAFLALTSGQCDADSPIDETLFQLIRTDFDDHESRILTNESLTEGSIRDDFFYPSGSVNTDIWDLYTGAVAPDSDGQPDHWLHLSHSTGAAGWAAAAASVKRMRFDLDRNHSVVFECRHKSGQSDNTELWFFGFKDSSLAGTKTIVTTNSNIIGFTQGATANTYKAVCAKAAASSTLQDNIGNASAWSKLKITVVSTGSGASITVRMYVDDIEISGSPFTTLANIPVVQLRPVLGCSDGGGSRDQYIDYVLATWSVRPLSN